MAVISQPQLSTVRARLLDAAEKVVVREGLPNLTLSAVAREAGVSKGGLLYHFATKSSLIAAIVVRLAARCEADQARAVQDDPDSPGSFTRAYLAIRSEPLNPEEQPIHAAILAAAGTDRQLLEPFRKRIREWQARLDSDGIDSAVAAIVRLAMDGLCLGTLLGIPVPEGDLRRRVIETLIAMTRGRPPASPPSRTRFQSPRLP